jgi:hypothetical protein
VVKLAPREQHHRSDEFLGQVVRHFEADSRFHFIARGLMMPGPGCLAPERRSESVRNPKPAFGKYW